MSERLPTLDIAVSESPRQVLQAIAVEARKLGTFKVDVINNFGGSEGHDIVELRSHAQSVHDELVIRFNTHKSQGTRIAVRPCARQWNPDDPPKYETYCQAARDFSGPVLRSYNSTHGTRYRLRVPTRKSMVPKLPHATDKLFKQFVNSVNKSVLSPFDWECFYKFVWFSRMRTMHDEDMTSLLIENGFTPEYAKDIASVYIHLCHFRACR